MYSSFQFLNYHPCDIEPGGSTAGALYKALQKCGEIQNRLESLQSESINLTETLVEACHAYGPYTERMPPKLAAWWKAYLVEHPEEAPVLQDDGISYRMSPVMPFNEAPDEMDALMRESKS